MYHETKIIFWFTVHVEQKRRQHTHSLVVKYKKYSRAGIKPLSATFGQVRPSVFNVGIQGEKGTYPAIALSMGRSIWDSDE